MQTIHIDISNANIIPAIYAKQGDVGRKFQAVITDGGTAYNIPSGTTLSMWYSGASGEGNYTHIGERSAFSVDGNKAVVEMITQMLSVPGEGKMCLVLNYGENQIASWNIEYVVESVPGAESEKAEEYYTAFSKAVSELPYPDESLSVAGKAADAAATGEALAIKAPAGYGINNDFKTVSTTAALDSYSTCGWVRFVNLTTDDLLMGCRTAVIRIDSCTNSVGNESLFQTAYLVGGTAQSVGVISRCCNGGAWQPWEWVNPPMELGVEYRTTERWNGKPVYTMMANIGALPNNTGKTTEGGPLPMGITPISAYGIGLNGKTGAVIPSRHIYLSVYGEWGTVYVNTDSDYSSYTGYTIVKYVKD